MSPLRKSLETYLALRRSLGVQLRSPAHRLRDFVEFADAEKATVITRDLALRWATATPTGGGRRLGDVRRFAAWLSAADPRTELIPRDLLPDRYERATPYIYSDDEVVAIVREAERLQSPTRLRAHTFSTLFGLIAATGLRVGEALGLDRDDVDLATGVLAIRRTKGGKSRFVPVHQTVRAALQRYAKQRESLFPRPSTPAFFLTERGTRPTLSNADRTFAVVCGRVGIRPLVKRWHVGRGPRIHDLRHRLAVQVLIRWYQQGRDVEYELPKLSTYLGHCTIRDTYWYLEAVPELLQLATERAMGAHLERP